MYNSMMSGINTSGISMIKTGNDQIDGMILYTLLTSFTSQLSSMIAILIGFIGIMIMFMYNNISPLIVKNIKKICLFIGLRNQINEIIIHFENSSNISTGWNQEVPDKNEDVKKIQNSKAYYALNHYLQKNKFNGVRSIKISSLLQKIIYTVSDNYIKNTISEKKKPVNPYGYINKVEETTNQLNDEYDGDEIINNIYLKCLETTLNNNASKCIYSIRSYVYDINYLINFVEEMIKIYEDDIKKRETDILYIHTYQNGGKFTTNTFSGDGVVNNQTFEHLFYDDKEEIINRVNKMSDVEWYTKRGLKNKMALIFEGPPGTGKTNTISAIANMTRRHIIEIPMCNVKTNQEFQYLMNISTINSKTYKKNEIILVFDEIDSIDLVSSKPIPYIQASKSMEKSINTQEIDNFYLSTNISEYKNEVVDLSKNIDTIKEALKQHTYEITEMIENKNNDKSNDEKDKKNETKPSLKHDDDKLNMKFMLSQLDGLSNQDGMIIIATTNNIKNIDIALCRDQRLEIISFNNMNKTNLKNMIKKYYGVDVEEKNLPNINVSSSTIKKIFSIHGDDLDGFINNLKKLDSTSL